MLQINPYLLSIEQLKSLLENRGLPKNLLDTNDKNDLIKLYYDHVQPLPQRQSKVIKKTEAFLVDSQSMLGSLSLKEASNVECKQKRKINSEGDNGKRFKEGLVNNLMDLDEGE